MKHGLGSVHYKDGTVFTGNLSNWVQNSALPLRSLLFTHERADHRTTRAAKQKHAWRQTKACLRARVELMPFINPLIAVLLSLLRFMLLPLVSFLRFTLLPSMLLLFMLWFFLLFARNSNGEISRLASCQTDTAFASGWLLLHMCARASAPARASINLNICVVHYACPGCRRHIRAQ